MRNRGRLLAVAGAAALLMALPMTAAHAADATGCSGSADSLAADGSVLSSASAPGAGGTQDDPLVVDPDGTVAWEGSTDSVITDGTWSVTVMGVPFLSGSFDNSDGSTSADGVVDVATAPAQVKWVLATSALIPVSGEMSGQGGTCSGSGFIAGTGESPMGSPIFLAGVGFIAVGGILVVVMVVGTKLVAVGTAGGGAV